MARTGGPLLRPDRLRHRGQIHHHSQGDSNVTIQTITPTDRQHWLAERVKDVTSTEVSALFGLSPYLTEFELWHRKRSAEVVEIADNERMKWGRRLESAIAAGAAEDNGWAIEPFDVYLRVPEARIGSSFDFKVSNDTGTGVLEIKNVDSLVFRNNWTVNDDGTIEAPEHIELQVQHQLEVCALPYAIIVALVGGNTQQVLVRQRDPEIGSQIRARVSEFWQSVDAGEQPSADYTRDADYIIRQLRGTANPDKVVIADAGLDELVRQYQHACREAEGAQTVKDAYKARILEAIGDAAKVKSAHGSISCGMTKDSPGTLITPDMVNTHIGARKGYRQFRFTPAK
jgi:putative phage-type endonuclease